jgi:hypothetical protein
MFRFERNSQRHLDADPSFAKDGNNGYLTNESLNIVVIFNFGVLRMGCASNAATRACFSDSSGTRLKKAMSLKFDPGQPPSM